MSVTLTLPTVLSRLAAGQRSIDAGAGTVGQIIDELSRKYPELEPRLRTPEGDPYPFVTIYLNDEDIRLSGGFAAVARDGDEVVVVPAIAGG